MITATVKPAQSNMTAVTNTKPVTSPAKTTTSPAIPPSKALANALAKSPAKPKKHIAEQAEMKGIIDVEATVVSSTSEPQENPTDEGAIDAALSEAQAEPSPAQETQPEQAPQPSTQLPARRSNTVAGFEGDFDQTDTRVPQIKIVQGSGPMSKLFQQGALIYNELELLPSPNPQKPEEQPVLRFVPMFIKKQFRENLSEEEQKAGNMPRICNSLDEVERLGGSTRWIGDEKPSWGPSARCLFLIEKPEGSDHPGFPLTLDGKDYAVAVYYVAGGGYKLVVPVLLDASKTMLLVPELGGDGKVLTTPTGGIIKRPLLWKCFWQFRWQRETRGKFNPYQPNLKLVSREETGPDVRIYVSDFVSDLSRVVISEE